MRRVVALSLAIFLAILPASRAQSDDPRNVGSVSSLIRVISSPQLAPGDAGSFAFNFTNPYSFAMQNVSLNVSIYQYASLEETLPVDTNWRWSFPRIENSTNPNNPRELHIRQGRPMDRLAPGDYSIERFRILTSQDMPHGSIFAQSSYFLRFWLEFTNTTGSEQIRMASRGYFSDAAWTDATTRYDPKNCTAVNVTNRCIGNLNLTRLGVYGVLPDSAFGVREPIPVWPFYGLIVLTAFFLVLAFLLWVEENPGQYPRIERRWLMFKGRLRRLVRVPFRKKV